MTDSPPNDPLEVDKDDRAVEEMLHKLPRSSMFAMPSGAGLARVGMFAVMLYAIVAIREPCSNSAGRFIRGFEPTLDAGNDNFGGMQLMTAEEFMRMHNMDAGSDGSSAATDSDAQ